MPEPWKARERAINEHFMHALRVAITDAKMTPSAVARATGFKQQQMSDWLSNKSTMTTPRLIQIAAAIGLDERGVGAMLARAMERARADGLLADPVEVFEHSDGEVSYAFIERVRPRLQRRPVSDAEAMMQEPRAAQTRDVQRELEGHEDSI